MNVNGYTPRTVTIADVSRRTGLSTATVSRVINNSPNVRAETRRRVLKAVRELGYSLNHTARSLARRRTDAIGVIFPSFDTGFFSEVLKGINEVAAAANRHLMVAFSLGGQDQEDLVREYLHAGRVDTLILMNLTMSEDFIRELNNASMPIVLIDRPVRAARLATVSLNNMGGAASGMEHLIDLGYRRIAVIRGPVDTFDAEQRLAGCTQALEAAGMELNKALTWQGDFTEAGGYRVVDAYLSRGELAPDAVFALNDQMALGAMAALRKHGLGVPDDVAVIGFDDIEPARHLGLTTVASPMRQMGREATELAVQAADPAADHGPSPGQSRLLQTELVVRRTCGQFLRSGSERVTTAQ